MKKSELVKIIKEVKAEMNESIWDDLSKEMYKFVLKTKSPQKLASAISNALEETIMKAEENKIELSPVINYLKTELKYM